MAKKINLENINKQLDKVAAEYEETALFSKPQSISPAEIILNPKNIAAANDDSESVRQLADSIEAAGLIHPLTVNKVGEHQYMLLSGERRYKAITTYLNWTAIPCTVYENLDPDMVVMVTVVANMEARDYTVADRLALYQQLYAALKNLKEKGKFKGGVGRKIASIMGVSEQQIGKYKRLTQNLSAEELNTVTNINTAVSSLNPGKTETQFQFSNKSEEQKQSRIPTQYDPLGGVWKPRILEAMRKKYSQNEAEIIAYFTEHPLAADRQRWLKNNYRNAGSFGWEYNDGQLGGIEHRPAGITIEYGEEKIVISYPMACSIIWDAIVSGDWPIPPAPEQAESIEESPAIEPVKPMDDTDRFECRIQCHQIVRAVGILLEKLPLNSMERLELNTSRATIQDIIKKYSLEEAED